MIGQCLDQTAHALHIHVSYVHCTKVEASCVPLMGLLCEGPGVQLRVRL